ncbi:scavenger receptor cysteine-rich domain-containing protein DMBT1-like [Acanthopagrus schlegelii]
MILFLSLGFSPGLVTVETGTSQEIDYIQLVGGSSRCSGELEVKQQGVWRKVDDASGQWNLKTADAACRQLDCGSAVSTGPIQSLTSIPVWRISSTCLQSGSAISDCVSTTTDSANYHLEVKCSDSIRLVNGNSLCSGRLEVKSNQRWSSVCEDDFDQQDAEVVCRELGCGAPSVLQGALYGEVEAPMWTSEFQCGGHESALLDCRTSGSDRNTCSPGKAVGLTCSEPNDIQLVGGSSSCVGRLEMKHKGKWKPVSLPLLFMWGLMSAAVVCRQLDCGSALSTETEHVVNTDTWTILSSCGRSESAIRECASIWPFSFPDTLKITCSDSVRLVNGNSLCSGRLEVKSNQRWSSVCEDDFDQQDAEVVCRELGCGAPSVLQGALYGEVEAPMWTKEFQCGGHESALLDCRTSGSDRNTCSPGKAVGLTCSEPNDIQLVGGSSSCVGRLEMKHKGKWKPVSHPLLSIWGLMSIAVVCRQLDCGSALSTETIHVNNTDTWMILSSCGQSVSAIRECASVSPSSSPNILKITCSDSVRLVNGNSLCSGRLEVKSNQRWSSVCEDDFDQQDAEVVCRELGCGVASVLHGALYGEVEAPMWTREFQCGGHESALLDCRTSGSDRNTCSPGKAVGLTCSEPDIVRLVGGSSHCAGEIEVKQQGVWKKVIDAMLQWNLKTADAVCRQLDCGSAVSTGPIQSLTSIPVWRISSTCLQSGSAVGDCVSTTTDSANYHLEVKCSDSVRLVNGNSLCSGRLEVKSNQRWSSVCEDDFDQQDAEVVCRELGCGAPSVLQGALYGEVEAPVWTREFQCGGHESALLDCRTSGSDRNTCSPGKAVGLTCSEPDIFWLVGGSSHCAGELELKQQGVWRKVDEAMLQWNLKTADAVCRQLDCGSAVLTGQIQSLTSIPVWRISSTCLQSGSAISDCVSATTDSANYHLEVKCSDSVRLVNGNSLCSGRLEVKSNQRWSSVCEDDFDQQDAEVVCRELGCGAPSVLQGALYGEVEAPVWTREFQCGGHESALLDCRTSGSDRNTCSPGKAVGLTCSEPDIVRLVGGSSSCAGELEVKQHGVWRKVDEEKSQWNLKTADAVCRQLDCGSAVSTERIKNKSPQTVRWVRSTCLQSGSAVRDCIATRINSTDYNLEVECSDSVRLVNGNSLCSGRLEVKSNQRWSSVCEDDFDQQDAEVVCRELGCGAPSVLQGALYGEVEAPMWTKEFQCGGHESALLDCRTSGSDRNTCSPGKAVGLTCSEAYFVRLVGGSSRCAGELEVKQQGVWKKVRDASGQWNLKTADAVCRQLDCGSAVSAGWIQRLTSIPVWWINSTCLQSGSAISDCVSTKTDTNNFHLEVNCSDSVRLVNGNSLCSGRLEVKSNQRWSSVCEDDFDQQDAEVVCRELGCGAPSVLQGALYGEVEAPMWTKEFQCGGHESALLDCRTSGSDRNTCSPGKAVGLTCSEPNDIQLVGGSSSCVGRLEMKHKGKWKPVSLWLFSMWDMMSAAVVCRQLYCGSALSIETIHVNNRDGWDIATSCGQSESAIRECVSISTISTHDFLKITCTDSIRLVNGNSLCSGRLEVKSNQRWSSVCEDDFDQQDAEVVCRELGCGAPSVLQGALYGEVEAPMWTSEFQCGGHESALLDCRTSGSDRNTCSPGEAVGLTCSEPDIVRLVGGSSSCAGELEVKQHGVWRKVDEEKSQWNLKTADAVCRQLDCGSAVSTERIKNKSPQTVRWVRSTCLQSGSAVRDCIATRINSTDYNLEVECSDSVRLVNGNSLCSGRLEVKSNQRWSSVCEDDFDQQDAEVVCRELGCGAPSVLQGALYGEVEAPMWTKEFQCGGHESALLDCRTSGSDRNTCSPGKAVGLTCSEPDIVRLVGGSSRCAGELEVKQQGVWRKVDESMLQWNLKTADAACRQLDCGSAVSTERIQSLTSIPVWRISSTCLQSESAISDCVSTTTDSANYHLEVKCSDSVRLVNGNSLCSGRLEVKSNQRWSSVCEDDFDQQDAEVVCRELGCGAPSVLQGALYGEVEAPMWTKVFQCGGHESALLDCRTSGSDRNTCSPGEAVGLTCSEPNDIQLVGGSSSCVGRLEMKHKGKWKPVSLWLFSMWGLMSAAVVCRQLDCGSALSTETEHVVNTDTWTILSSCGQSESAIRECASILPILSQDTLKITCSDSVRLVNGNSLCSGRLEVKSNQRWSSVCEDDFDQQDAEVVCRELGCGAPSVLQGALYGEVEAPMWTREFQCGGHESALLDCRTSGSDRNTCSPGKAVGLTCSEPDIVRLSGGTSRCDGTLEMKQRGEWRPVTNIVSGWDQKLASVACRQLDCGSVVSTKIRKPSDKPAWWISETCVQSESIPLLRECLLVPDQVPPPVSREVICSDILAQPNISFSPHNDGLSEDKQLQVLLGSSFTISCSILPQHPGGSFQLTLTNSATPQNYTLAAVNHSAHFLFSAADHTHQGDYICVYHVYVFSCKFSSESRRLYVAVAASLTDLIIRLALVMLMVAFSAAMFFYYKVSRRQMAKREDNIELDYLGGAQDGNSGAEEAGGEGPQ